MAIDLIGGLDQAIKTYDYYKRRREADEEKERKEREAEERALGLKAFYGDMLTGKEGLTPYDEPIPGEPDADRSLIPPGSIAERHISPMGLPAPQPGQSFPNEPYRERSDIAALPSFQDLAPESVPGAVNFGMGMVDQERDRYEAEADERQRELEEEERLEKLWALAPPWLTRLRGTGLEPSTDAINKALQPPEPFEEELEFERRAQEIAPMFGEGGAYETGMPADWSFDKQKMAGRGYDIAEQQAQKSPDQMLSEMLGTGYTTWQLGLPDEVIARAAGGDSEALEMVYEAYQRITTPAPKGRGDSLQPPQPKSRLSMFADYMGMSEKDVFDRLNKKTSPTKTGKQWDTPDPDDLVLDDELWVKRGYWQDTYEGGAEWAYPDLRSDWEKFKAMIDEQEVASPGQGAPGQAETFPGWYQDLPDAHKELAGQYKAEGKSWDEIYNIFFVEE